MRRFAARTSIRVVAAALVGLLAPALALAAVAYRGEGASPVAPPRHPTVARAAFGEAIRLRTESRAGSCPVPVGKQVAAVQAFADMMPVFRHPRCTNCHGGMDIFSDRHPGASALDEELDPRTGIRTHEFTEAFEAQCSDCHDGLQGWTMPPTGMWFVDPESGAPKSTETLCQQVKGFGNRTGALFIEHIFNDHNGIQFIAAGFLGDRALGPDGLSEFHLTADPPPGTQRDLTDEASRWVDLLEARGGWPGDPECGCVMPTIKLRIHHRAEDDTTDFSPIVDFAGEVTFEVTLTPRSVDPRTGSVSYLGETSLVRTLQVHYTAAVCTGPISESEDWMFITHIEPEATTMNLRFAFRDYNHRANLRCTHRRTRQQFDDEGDALIVALFTQLREIQVPLEIGSTRRESVTETWGSTESIEVTVVDATTGG